MPSIRRNPSPKLSPELLIGIVIALAVTGIPSTVQNFLDRQKYESAIQHCEWVAALLPSSSLTRSLVPFD